MNTPAEITASRLWRDRAQIREQERNYAQECARIAEEKVAILTAENDRLATENAILRAQLAPDSAQTSTEIDRQMEALRSALTEALRTDQINCSGGPAFAADGIGLGEAEAAARRT